MSNEDPQALEVAGQVLAVLGNNNYRVLLSQDGQERELLCHLSGKMRRFKINVTVGDTVRVVLAPPYDRGRITFREK